MLTNKSRQITVSEMAPHIHGFRAGENKVDKLSEWLINWIVLSLECGKIKPSDFLPQKGDLACHIGVSKGTMQNVFRRVEDAGYIASKQRIGTYIRDYNAENKTKKLTSKRELAVEIVKKFIIENDYRIGDKLISARRFADITGFSNSTLQVAMNILVSEKILKKEENSYIINNLDYEVEKIQLKTLVEKTADEIKDFVTQNLTAGEKLPPNSLLVKKFKVSIKTIHDAIKILSKEGLVYTRRGQYGTIYLGNNAPDNTEYFYEKIEQKIRQFIASNCEVGNKIPTIKDFANEYNTSEKTIKKALDNLAEEGYVTFVRGRYGGTFVTDIPQPSSEAYKWLAISTDFMAN
jgi:DNA-binding GntR family transcriptional regulator